MKKLFISLIAATLLLASCGEEPTNTTTMTDFDQTAAPVAGEQIAVIKTNKGTIKFKFFSEQAPETSKNFQELAKKGLDRKSVV